MMRLNLPDVDGRELEEIRKVLESGYLTQGPKVAEFERKVAEYVGCKHAFAMSSCTTALHLSLVALGIKPGDDVLVSDFTFPATGNVVVQQGATPVLVDILLDSFTMDPNDLAAKITKRTKAIIAVDTFGCAADMASLRSIADPLGIAVIEDAACALGARCGDNYCGNISTMGCFSFHPRKVITTGEGGMITTNDEHLADRIRLLRSHGGVRTGAWFQYPEAGFNYRMSDIQGAMGSVQMDKLSMLIERRVELAGELKAKMRGVPGIQLPSKPEWGSHIYQSFVILLDRRLNRDRLISDIRAAGIEATLGTYALHAEPFYQRSFGYRDGQLPNSYKAFCHAVSLPLYPSMSETDVDAVAQSLKKAVEDQA
jgi:dTDP-4-amino-4,6-dideoxygalactose transaminase